MTTQPPIPLSNRLTGTDSIPKIFSRIYNDGKAWSVLLEWGIVPSKKSPLTDKQLFLLHDQLLNLIRDLRSLPTTEIRVYEEISDIEIIQDIELLKEFLLHRQEIISKRTLYDLKKARAREHILAGFVIALNQIAEKKA